MVVVTCVVSRMLHGEFTCICTLLGVWAPINRIVVKSEIGKL